MTGRQLQPQFAPGGHDVVRRARIPPSALLALAFVGGAGVNAQERVILLPGQCVLPDLMSQRRVKDES